MLLLKYPEAIDILQQGLKLDNKNPDMLKLLKETQEKQKKISEKDENKQL